MEEGNAEPVVLSWENGVATITLARPANRNALTVEMGEGLVRSLAEAEASGARAIVLSAAGPAFSGGMDLRETDPARIRRALELLVEAIRSLLASRLPVLARVHGPVRAGGLGLVCAADLVIAAEEVDLAFPEARLGVAPSVISLSVLPRLRVPAARRLFLLGERVSAREAVALGIFDESVPAAALDETLQARLEALSHAAPAGLHASKALVNGPIVADVDRRARDLVEASAALFIARAGAGRR